MNALLAMTGRHFDSHVFLMILYDCCDIGRIYIDILND